MRRALDGLYAGALWLAALCLVVIAIMVGVQVSGRVVDMVVGLFGIRPLGYVVLSLAEICAYLLAAASFLALAATLRSGAHIRVTMVLAMLSEHTRRHVEIFAFAFAAVASGYMSWQLIQFAWVSFRFNEVSSGVVRVPLAYPQTAVAVGAAILTIALIDELVTVIWRGHPTFRGTEDAITLGKEG
jgi:TRAP-type C4-dicarboxylate transport system permease small subunit